MIEDTQEIERLLIEYNNMLLESGRLQNTMGMYVNELNKLAGKPDKKTGVVKVTGVTLIGVITRRQSVKYEKEHGAPHPLIVLAEKYPLLEEYISVDIREKSWVQKMVDEVEKEDEADPLLNACVAELSKVRTVSDARPSLKIETKK